MLPLTATPELARLKSMFVLLPDIPSFEMGK
jgi:hypothetical protein